MCAVELGGLRACGRASPATCTLCGLLLPQPQLGAAQLDKGAGIAVSDPCQLCAVQAKAAGSAAVLSHGAPVRQVASTRASSGHVCAGVHLLNQ
jgi:hypothetical protein